jgi:hypothetical protein
MKTVLRTRCAVVHVIYCAVRSLMRFYVYSTPCKRVRSAHVTEFFDRTSFHDLTSRFFQSRSLSLSLSLVPSSIIICACVLVYLLQPRIPNTHTHAHSHASRRIIIRAAAVPNSRVRKSERKNKKDAPARRFATGLLLQCKHTQV